MPKSFGDAFDDNLLLASLPDDARIDIRPHLERLRIETGKVIEHPLEPVQKILFPIDCIGSTVAVDTGGKQIEVGLFGFEGMSGQCVVTGALMSPLQTFMQVAGSAWVMNAETLAGLLADREDVRRHLLRYFHTQTIQTSQTALSNSHGKLEERLARWLLMCHDRQRGDRISLTHEFLSVMLGVRRAGVTVAMHLLEGKGLIRAERGLITVLDRADLEIEARGSFGMAEREYRRVFGIS